MDLLLFKGLLNFETADVLKAFGTPFKIPKGENLYRDGEVGILLNGNATVCRSCDTGSNITVRSISSGEIFGVASVFGEWEPGKSRIEAKSDCSVLYATEETLREIFKNYPKVAVNYISFLSDRIRFLNRRIDTFSAGNVVQRLYEYLISQAIDGKVDLDFGLAELSRRLKIGRSSLYRSLEILETSGLIERHKTTFIIK